MEEERIDKIILERGLVSTRVRAEEIIKKYGVKVYTIGVGTMGKAMGPVARRPDGGFVFGLVDVEIDEELLQDIAKKTGGRYFRATNMASLEDVYAEIDKMERTKIEKTTLKRTREEFHWFVSLALISMLLYMILSNTIFRTIVQ